jgi:hypothetical protein
LENFKTALSGTDWSHVTDINSVDDAYASFWNTFFLYCFILLKQDNG